LAEDDLTLDSYKTAIEDWKTRKDQLLKQRESVTTINSQVEKVSLLSLLRLKSNQSKNLCNGLLHV